MNPQNNPQSDFNLPLPMPQNLQTGQTNSASPQAAQPQGPPPSTLPAFMTGPAPAPQAAVSNPQQTTNPQAADDNDRIEKEWVSKAKQIALQTTNDPYQQNLQLAHMKADYLQKRYGKIIKMTE